MFKSNVMNRLDGLKGSHRGVIFQALHNFGKTGVAKKVAVQTVVAEECAAWTHMKTAYHTYPKCVRLVFVANQSPSMAVPTCVMPQL